MKKEKSLKTRIAERAEAELKKQVDAMNNRNCGNVATGEVKRRGRKRKEPVLVDEAFKQIRELAKKDMDNAEIPNQKAKADCGKPRLSLVPMKILEAIARIREYGNKKYHDPNNWKTVEVERYRDAAMRHMVAYIEDPSGVDEESGLPHLWHLACNVSFLVELEDLRMK